MGHRANFVVIREGRAAAFEDQWGAISCFEWFAEGPDRAREVLSGFERADGLMESAWAEGGYLIDFDERLGIVFGYPVGAFDEDFDVPAPDHPLWMKSGLDYLKQIAPHWSGWRLVEDSRGVDAFAAHLARRGIRDVALPPPSQLSRLRDLVEYRA